MLKISGHGRIGSGEHHTPGGIPLQRIRDPTGKFPADSGATKDFRGRRIVCYRSAANNPVDVGTYAGAPFRYKRSAFCNLAASIVASIVVVRHVLRENHSSGLDRIVYVVVPAVVIAVVPVISRRLQFENALSAFYDASGIRAHPRIFVDSGVYS